MLKEQNTPIDGGKPKSFPPLQNLVSHQNTKMIDKYTQSDYDEYEEPFLLTMALFLLMPLAPTIAAGIIWTILKLLQMNP